jgi:hypothetical protein
MLGDYGPQFQEPLARVREAASLVLMVLAAWVYKGTGSGLHNFVIGVFDDLVPVSYETGAPGGWPNDLYPPGSQDASQFSTSSPGTLENSPALSVTRASPATMHGGNQEIIRTDQRAGSLQCRSHLGILLIGAFFVRVARLFTIQWSLK